VRAASLHLLAAALLGGAGAADRVVVRAGRILTGTGEAIERGMIVIERGRIVSVGPYREVPAGAQVVEADDETVIPGLVDAHTSLADAGRDADESVSLDIRAIDGFDVYASGWRHLAGGVTTVYLSPGSQRLLSGRGAVVKTAGAARVLKETAGFRATLGERPKHPPMLYDPPVPASAERPIRPARRQYPTTRPGEFAELRRVAPVLKASQETLYLQAHTEDDLVKAVLFGAEHGLRVTLVDAEEAPSVAAFLAERKVPVIFNPGFGPTRRNLGDPARPVLQPPGRPEGAAVLAKAGVALALHAPEDSDTRDLLFLAGSAVRHGLPEADALAAVTRVPAEILGVADRVGSLRAGRDADLVFLGGDPFGGHAEVRRVMIDGIFVHRRKDADVQTYRSLRDAGGRERKVLAIRGGRAITVTQGPIQNGLILVEEGKIAYAGRERPLPPGAEVIDASGLTLVPGFIDASSHLGFHAEQSEAGLRRSKVSGIPPVASVPPSRWVDPADPAFARAAAAGVTSVLLVPETEGVCSLLKLSGERIGVVREAAALKFPAGGGSAGRQALKDRLKRGRAYVDEWDAFERARREAVPAKEAPKDALGGAWKAVLEGGESGKIEASMELKLESAKVTGILTAASGKAEALEGTFEQNELRAAGPAGPARLELTARLVAAEHLKGLWKRGSAQGPFEARREPPAPPKPPPKEPKREEALEPYRKLFAKEIPALVAAGDVPSLEAAIRVLREENDVDVVFVGAEAALAADPAAAAKASGAILGPAFVQESRGARINVPESLAARGIAAAFGSTGIEGTRSLPLQAAFAVRQGMDPFDALKALTIGPARLLKAEARLGSIERGRDADLVFWTGDPFSASSRVKRVLVEGRTVWEEPR
jgi:imidazolonepropionase-like amidohydrolase